MAFVPLCVSQCVGPIVPLGLISMSTAPANRELLEDRGWALTLCPEPALGLARGRGPVSVCLFLTVEQI